MPGYALGQHVMPACDQLLVAMVMLPCWGGGQGGRLVTACTFSTTGLFATWSHHQQIQTMWNTPSSSVATQWHEPICFAFHWLIFSLSLFFFVADLSTWILNFVGEEILHSKQKLRQRVSVWVCIWVCIFMCLCLQAYSTDFLWLLVLWHCY